MKQLSFLFFATLFSLYSLACVAQDTGPASKAEKIEILNQVVKKLAGDSNFVSVFADIEDACNSDFISCKKGKIVGLNFQLADLRGTIPDELASMHDLIWINLEYNYLHGGIPNGLSEMPQLEELLLTGNHLTGEKPSDYKFLKRLKVFDESKNVAFLKMEALESTIDSTATKDAKAAEQSKPQASKEEISKIVERMPRFPGCENLGSTDKEKERCSKEKMLMYIYKSLKYPDFAREKGVEGMAVVQFTIEVDGSVRKINIVRDPGARCGNASAWVVDRMNYLPERWTPGEQRGKPVWVLYTLPVKFKLP